MLVFEEGGKTGVPGEKALGARARINNKPQSGNRTRTTLMQGEHSHYCIIPVVKICRLVLLRVQKSKMTTISITGTS